MESEKDKHGPSDINQWRCHYTAFIDLYPSTFHCTHIVFILNINIIIIIFVLLLYLQCVDSCSLPAEFTLKPWRSAWVRVARTRTRGRPPHARSRPASSGSTRQSTGRKGDGFQIHKIHRILHKWMNTISTQFPHYANMQNIKSGPIRDSHSLKFTGLSRNCRNPQIITQLIGNICDRYNKFSPQITFHPRNHRAPVKSYPGLIPLT